MWSRTAKAGDSLYTQVDFPVITGNSVAIPAGTYVQGTILSITKPSHFKSRAEIQALFTTLIFADGYAVQLPALPSIAAATQNAAGTASAPTSRLPSAPSVMRLTIGVSYSNDLLLDNGTQFDITLASPLTLAANQIAAANALSHSFDVGQLKSATLCRPTPGTPGTPGTPDTVIPGSSGTPSTTIPGGPGMPDIVIPGTPATPPTVIPGTPGSPGSPGQSCPRPPIVTSSELVSTPQPQSATSASPSNP